MNCLYRTKLTLGEKMSRRPTAILWILLVIVAVVITASIIPWKFNYWKAIGSLLSPVPMYQDSHRHILKFILYLLGTIFFSGGVIAIVNNFIRTTGERYVNGTARYRFRGHVLFLGFDPLMIGTLRNEIDSAAVQHSDIVVAVPDQVASVRNEIHRHLSTEQARRVIFIRCSRINVDDLRKLAWAKKARKIFIIGQPDEETHDTLNLKCLGLLAAIYPQQGVETPAPCYYYLRNQSTFYMIHRIEYRPESLRKHILQAGLAFDKKSVGQFLKASEPFNFHESIARHVLFSDNYMSGDALRLNAVAGDPHVVIYGMTPMGTALMRDVLMTQHFPGRRLHVTMIDENARAEMHNLIGRHRPFFENCHYTFNDLTTETTADDHPAQLDFLDVDVDFIQCDASHPRLTDYLRECASREKGTLAIAICTQDSPRNMALALYMPRIVFENKVPIWVYQTGDNSMNAFVENDDQNNLYSSIRVFSTMDYGISDRRTSWQWQLAQAVSDNYAQKHPFDPDYRWEFLQPMHRWSSLYGAISKISMLHNLGQDHTPILLTNEERTQLALAEHNRWNTEKLLNGWEPAAPGEGKTLFRHDKIVDYRHLDEASKEKDKEQTDAVVKELNRPGKVAK